MEEKGRETEFEMLARLIKEESEGIRSVMVTKDDLKDELNELKQELRSEMHSTVDTATEKMLDEIRPIARAVDKDAVSILDHEKRITRLEQGAPITQ